MNEVGAGFCGVQTGFCGVQTGFCELPGFEQDIAGFMAAWPPLPPLSSDGKIKTATPFPDNFECIREEKEIEDLMEYKNSLACKLFSMNVKNTTMSKKNAFVIPSIMAPRKII